MTTMLSVALALLINFFFVFVVIACMAWSFIVLVRFWAALLEVPVDVAATFEVWRRLRNLGLVVYLWVLLEIFFLKVGNRACDSSFDEPDADSCRSIRLPEDAGGRKMLWKCSMFMPFGMLSIESP